MFDPYRKWFGIPVKDQPPNHYRLLGVELYENDLDVIEGAAERQMNFVRQYQSGEHAADAAKILNELAIARLCLMKPATKSSYDEKLRGQLAPLTDSPDDFSDLPITDLQPKRSKSKKSASRKSQGIPPNMLLLGGVGLAICLLAAFLLSPRRPRQVLPQPEQVTSVAPATVANSNPQPSIASKEERSHDDSFLWPVRKLMVEPAGDPVNLLKAINLPRDVAKGDWQQTSDALIGARDSRIYLPTKLPDDYQLKLTVRRLEGNEGLSVGFMMSGRQGIVALDGWNSTISGLYLDGREPTDNCTTKKRKFFKDQSTSEIVFTVHPGHLHVRFDKETVTDWHGNPERLFLHPVFEMPCRESVFLSTSAKVVVESAMMVPIKPEPLNPRVARLDREIEILPLTDPDRDSERGIWALNKNSLSSPEGGGKYYLPTIVPDAYTLSAMVEVPENGPDNATLTIGLPSSKEICQLTIVNSDCLGIDMIDGRRWNENEARRSGSYLKKGVPARIECTVTKDGIRCEIDGHTLVEWRGEADRLSLPGDWALADARRLFLATQHHIRFRDIKLGPPTPAPKLPSHPPFAVGKEVDLLALVSPERDALNGKWERDGTSIVMPVANGLSRLVIPTEVPPEYKLSMRVSRDLEGERELNVSLPFANSQADIVIDGAGTSGMHLDFRNTPENITTYREPVMVDATPVDLTFFVRRTGLQVVCGEKKIIDWVGNPLRASWHWGRTVPDGRIAIGCWHQKLKFEKLVLEPLPPSSFPDVSPLGEDGKLLPILDVRRDSRNGDWKLDSEGLLSPVAHAPRIQIPVAPPEKYVLSANIERREGTYGIAIGLIVGGHCCSAALDGDMGTAAGLELLDGRSFNDSVNLTRRKYGSPLFPVGKTIPVRCVVLGDAVIVKCGETEVIRWHGDPRRFSQSPIYYPPRYTAADGARLWLAAHSAAFLIRDLELKPLSDVELKDIRQTVSDVYPTTSLLDVPLSTGPLTPKNSAFAATSTASTDESWLLERQANARALLVMNDHGDQKAAIEACRHQRLPFELYHDFRKKDYSRYSLVVVGTNIMDAWGEPANKHPSAFQPLIDFVQSGGHLLVFNTFNGRNMEHLVPLGIVTGFNHATTFEKVPKLSDILFDGAEDLVPPGNYLQQAGNFTVQKPHVILLRRGPGSFAGEPTFATLRHGKGRLTYCSVEPGYGTPPGYWLLQVGIRWAARGGPVSDGDLQHANSAEAEFLKRPEVRGKKLEILEAKYGIEGAPVVVTPIVAAGAKSGRLVMAVDPSLVGGDPKFGTSKYLHLRYRLNGLEEFRVFNDFQPVVLGTRNVPDKVTDDKFKLVEVRWGVGVYSPTNGIDLTRQFKQLVSNNGLHPTREAQDQATNGLPDPMFNVAKSLFVHYHYNGKEHADVFSDGALIAVGDPIETK